MMSIKSLVSWLACCMALLGPVLTSAKSLAITADDQVTELYVDGVQKTNLPNANSVNTADIVAIPDNFQLIAVKGTNPIPPFAGIMASTDGRPFVTDVSWKCSKVFTANWFTLTFDDSTWPAALISTKSDTLTETGISKNASWIWTSSQSDTPVYCRGKAKTLAITADDQVGELYVDGVQQTNLTNANVVNSADYVPLPNNYQLIAVKGVNILPPYVGIMASVLSGTFVTDVSWKCTKVFTANWFTLTFDDSTWPAAVISTKSDTLTETGISSSAKWIWTSSASDTPVYCRGHPKSLAITADDQVTELYVDGVQKTNLPNANSVNTADNVAIPDNFKLVAVKGTNPIPPFAGIMAAVQGTQFVTNVSWKCSKVFTANWFTLTFDDSQWPAALISTKSDTLTITGISSSAKWIWTSSASDTPVYCRGRYTGSK